MDSAIKALSKKSKIAVTFVDVTDSAKILEKRHLCGPAAALVIGEAVAAVAVMASNISGKDEKISMQFRTEGSVEGGLFEATSTGLLRGYTNIKILGDLDGNENLSVEKVMPNEGDFCVQQSNESKIIANSMYRLKPASIRAVLARYYNETLQRPSAVEIFTSIEDGYLKKAVALIVEKMPDGNSEVFIPILESFDSKEIHKYLAGDYEWEGLKKVLKLDDLEIEEVCEFGFGCQCSRGRVVSMLESLDKVELQEIANAGMGQDINCHFCGEDYRITDDEIKEMLK